MRECDPFIHEPPKSKEDIEKKRVIVFNQQKEIIAQGKYEQVTCPCGWKLPSRLAYRCYFCGVFLCPSCAGKHFGERPLMAKLERDLLPVSCE